MIVKKFLFDLGNVFFDWNPERILKPIFNDDERMNFFINNISFPLLDTRCDAGITIEVAVNDAIKKFPEFEKEIKFYYPNHGNMVGGFFQKTVDVFYKIKELNYPCFVLSNWSAETYEGMEEKYPFLKDFDGKIISGRDFLIKPDPAIYELAISRFNLIPEETLFIDDRLDNIEAAQNLNFQTIHLTNPSLIQDLIDPYIN
jgi:2-haloacid dehalogenase|tara:strand:+ start:42 stop:644 length:603 start_codon:yes stop_codon:yes gene_type:complete